MTGIFRFYQDSVQYVGPFGLKEWLYFPIAYSKFLYYELSQPVKNIYYRWRYKNG